MKIRIWPGIDIDCGEEEIKRLINELSDRAKNMYYETGTPSFKIGVSACDYLRVKEIAKKGYHPTLGLNDVDVPVFSGVLGVFELFLLYEGCAIPANRLQDFVRLEVGV